MTPEEQARVVIDQKLQQSGWVIQDMKRLNLSVSIGVAVREFPTSTGEVDYALFVEGAPIGVIEAKRSEAGENITVKETLMVNHVEKWKLNELECVVDEFESAICDKVNESKLKFFHDYKSLLFFMAGKSVETMKEILYLVQCGCPEGELSLARNLYEQFVIAEFFHTHKADGNFQDYIDDFFADYEIQQNKLLAFSAEYVENNIEKKQQAEQRITEIRANAHSKKKSTYWWADKDTFSNMAIDLIKRQTDPDFKKFTAMYHMIYKRACVSLHASCAGNILRLGDDSEFFGVDNRPRENGHSTPLLLGVYSFLYVTCIVCEEFGIDFTDWNLRLNDLLVYYNSLLEGDKNV